MGANTEFRVGDSANDLLRKILTVLGLSTPSGGGGPVSGTVDVGNFPAIQAVSGSVSVSNLPATQPVSGSVSVSNFPATQPVSGTVTVGGSVSVSNFPATQPVSGSVSVSNFPSTQVVLGSLAVVTAEFTRPANTTQYAANDVVGPHTTAAVMTFTNIALASNGNGYITNARLMKSQTNTTDALFRLWLFNTSVTPISDNSPFTLLFTNRTNCLGYIDFVCITEGSGSDSASAIVDNINLKFACTGGVRNIYGVLEAKQAYAPASNSEQFFVELTAIQN